MRQATKDGRIAGNFFHKDILSIDQFDKESLDILFTKITQLKNSYKTGKLPQPLQGKVLTLLFYEPSSRTFASFAASIKRLGGQTIDIQNPMQVSSVAKGETLEDTIRTFSSYSDGIVIRHPEVGSANKAAEVTDIPVFNAGDGIGEHPTQALLDAYTIFEMNGRLDNITGLIAGDLLNGRTVHSLVKLLSLYKRVTLYLLAPKELRLHQDDIRAAKGLKLIEITSEKEIPKNADFWYWTRVQKERFPSLAEYEKVKNKFIVTKELFDTYAGRNTFIMHPLPRVGEISTEIDSDNRAIYFRSQIQNGMFTRMALMSLVFSK